MRKFKKIFSVVLAFSLVFCLFASFAQAKATITDVKITTLPTKLKFYKGSDWGYGIWSGSEELEVEKWTWTPMSNKISFLRNPGGGRTPERGMIDMSGLQIEVTYSDKSKKTIAYKESINSAGIISANILVAAIREYQVGKNTLEVYLAENIAVYDSYEIEIINSSAPNVRAKGDVNNDSKVNSSDALLVLNHAVGEKEIPVKDREYADMNNDNALNSTDALMILRVAVGM